MMDLYNLSVHVNKPISIDSRVYVTLQTPNFASKQAFAAWRHRMIEYIDARRKSMDMKKEKSMPYSIVYVPEVFVDIDDDEDDLARLDTDDVIFIAKRQDPYDEGDMSSHEDVPGHYTVLVLHDLHDIVERRLGYPMDDVVSSSLRIIRTLLLLCCGFLMSLFVIRNNPQSMLGTY